MADPRCAGQAGRWTNVEPSAALPSRWTKLLLALAVLLFLGWLTLLGPAQDVAPALPARAQELDGVAMQGATATLSLPLVTVAPGEQITVPLTLALNEGQVYSADVVLTHDPAVAAAVRVEQGALAAGWSIASNLTTPGVVWVALAGANPIEMGGELLLFVFDATGPAGSETDLTLTRGDLNEGGIPTTLQHGHLTVQRYAVYLPLVLKQ